jgi:hypothetical protein
VAGVAGANLCSDGQAVGDVIGPGQRAQRDSSWFLGEISYKFLPWFTGGFGVSTYQPIRKEGLGLANPFFRTIPTANVTTLYLSGAMAVFGNPTFRYVREIRGEHDALLEFTTEIDGIQVNGIDLITFDDAGRIVEFKVMVRPLKAMQVVHQKMGEMLQRLAPSPASASSGPRAGA